MICAVLYGFNVASIGVVVFEVNAILAGPGLSAIGIGYSLLFSGFGWLMGPPVAGEESSQAYCCSQLWVWQLFCGQDL